MPGTTEDTSTEQDPTFTYERAGNYTATLTVTDPTGQRGSASVDVQVTSGEECPTGPVRSDEFDGDSLDTNRWEVLRSADNFEVADGQLRLPIGNGSIYGPGTSAQNIIVQDTPEGAWQVTAKITAEQLTENYHQAGLRVYSDDDNWASVHMISAGGQRDIEFIYESAGQPRNEAADKLGGIPADGADDLLRAARVRRRAAHGLLLLRRRRVPAGRAAGFAQRASPTRASARRRSPTWHRRCRTPSSTGSASSRTAPRAAGPWSPTSSTAARSRARPGRSCARTRT